MIEIKYVQAKDKEFWYSLDKHLPEQEFMNKVDSKRGYVLLDDRERIGLLRYNLPFVRRITAAIAAERQHSVRAYRKTFYTHFFVPKEDCVRSLQITAMGKMTPCEKNRKDDMCSRGTFQRDKYPKHRVQAAAGLADEDGI